jgi:hypothetical protein
MANLIIPDTTPGTITDPSGEQTELPTLPLSLDDARLLREYKKFLSRQGLREALYCNECWAGTKEDGCKAFVNDGAIMIACRCRLRTFNGQTF